MKGTIGGGVESLPLFFQHATPPDDFELSEEVHERVGWALPVEPLLPLAFRGNELRVTSSVYLDFLMLESLIVNDYEALLMPLPLVALAPARVSLSLPTKLPRSLMRALVRNERPKRMATVLRLAVYGEAITE